ncbi:MAG: hypothetical protein JWN46_3040 [Acidimicrobiales bacterium]|nr:hypothetical protein [Acidimicrobiales bacterium]
MSASDPTPTSAAGRLQEGVAGLRVPEPSADAERLLFQVSMALPVVGVALIVLAWYNASGTAYVADQIPMLISGGLLGLGLVLVGLGLFLRFSVTRLLRFWLARLVAEHQAQTDRMVEALDRIEAAVRDATTEAPVAVKVSEADRN